MTKPRHAHPVLSAPPRHVRIVRMVLLVLFFALAGLWLHDHAPGLYLVFLLGAIGFTVALGIVAYRRDLS